MELPTVRLGDYSPSRMRQQVWSLVHGRWSTSRQFCSHFVGYRSGNGLCSSWRYWSTTSASMGVHLPTWLAAATWSAAAGPVLDRRRQRPNWRSHQPERCLATDLLPSTDQVRETVYQHSLSVSHCLRQQTRDASVWTTAVAFVIWNKRL